MPNHQSKQISDPTRQAWSNKFKLSNNILVDKKLNDKLIGLLDTEFLKYGTVAKKFGQTLKSKELCRYQSRLLNEYFSKPQEYLTVDCDRLTLSMEVSNNDLKRLSNAELFLKPTVNAISEILTIKPCSVGRLNRLRGNVHRPLYDFGYKLTLYNDSRRFVHIAVATGENEQRPKKSLRIDLVPQRFTDLELKLLLNHIKSKLTANRYKQLIKNAVVTRIDFGINLPGIMSTFVWPVNHSERTASTMPVGNKKLLTETTYIGSRQSSHFIIYEKLLKELDVEVTARYFTESDKIAKVLSELAITTRIERRHFTNRRKGNKDSQGKPVEPPLLVKNLTKDVTAYFDSIELIDPIHLSTFPNKKLAKVLRKKTPQLIHEQIEVSELGTLRIKDNWQYMATFRLLKHYKGLLLETENIKDALIKELVKPFKAVVGGNAPRELSISDNPSPVNNELVEISEQQDAVTSDYKNTIVIAGAGTGKTRTIINRMLHLVDDGVTPSRIALIAFTDKAVTEMKTRLRNSGELPDDLKIKTFHSWALDTIKKHEDYKKVKVLGVEPAKGVLLDIVSELGYVKPKLVNTLSSFIDYCTNRMLTPIEAYERHDVCQVLKLKEVKNVLKRFKKWKEDNGRVDFGDILAIAHDLLRTEAKFLKQIVQDNRHFLLDEAQDSNTLQWTILQILSEKGTSLFCVGDPAQSIYGFRGAQPDYMDNFEKDFKNSGTYYLTSNFRSSPLLLHLSNFVRQQINPLYPKLIPHWSVKHEQQFMPVVTECSSIEQMITHVAEIIHSELALGSKLTDIAVLVRNRFKIWNEGGDAKFNQLVEELDTQMQSKPIDNAEYKRGSLKDSIYTQHESKGKEWPIVITIDPRFNQYYEEHYVEHLTLSYVTLSRAKQKLYAVNARDAINKFIDKTNAEHVLDKIQNEELGLLEFK